MMKMPLVRLHDRLAGKPTPHNRKGRIKDWQPERENRHDQRDNRRAFHYADDGNTREHEAEEHAARITHKDFRGIEIEKQESESRPRQRRRNHRHYEDIHAKRDETDGQRSDSRNPRRKTVKTVGDVCAIGNGCDDECYNYYKTT